MVLPDKYIAIEQSLMGLSAFILDLIDKDEVTVEKLWDKFDKKYLKDPDTRLSHQPSFQKFIITLNFMYATNMINCDIEREVIFNENIKPELPNKLYLLIGCQKFTF